LLPRSQLRLVPHNSIIIIITINIINNVISEEALKQPSATYRTPKRHPPWKTRSWIPSSETEARSTIAHQAALFFSSLYKMQLGLEASSPKSPTSQGLNESTQKGNTSKRKFPGYQEGVEDTKNGTPERKEQMMDHNEEFTNTFRKKSKVASPESRP